MKCILDIFKTSRLAGSGRYTFAKSPFGIHRKLKVKRNQRNGRFCKK